VTDRHRHRVMFSGRVSEDGDLLTWSEWSFALGSQPIATDFHQIPAWGEYLLPLSRVAVVGVQFQYKGPMSNLCYYKPPLTYTPERFMATYV